MSGTAGSPPPGWYADPAHEAPERWWDGTAWTTVTRQQQPTPAPGPRRREAEARIVHLPETTRWAWLLGLAPVWVPGAYWGVAFGIGLPVPPLLLAAAASAIIVLAAIVDTAAMTASGYPSRPRWLFVLLTPITYLAVRTVVSRQHSGGGAGPLIAFLVTLPFGAAAFWYAAVASVAELSLF